MVRRQHCPGAPVVLRQLPHVPRPTARCSYQTVRVLEEGRHDARLALVYAMVPRYTESSCDNVTLKGLQPSVSLGVQNKWDATCIDRLGRVQRVVSFGAAAGRWRG